MEQVLALHFSFSLRLLMTPEGAFNTPLNIPQRLSNCEKCFREFQRICFSDLLIKTSRRHQTN